MPGRYIVNPFTNRLDYYILSVYIDFLLQEDGDYLLQETGEKIVLEYE